MNGAEFNEAYGQHKDVLYRFARRMTGSNDHNSEFDHQVGKPFRSITVAALSTPACDRAATVRERLRMLSASHSLE